MSKTNLEDERLAVAKQEFELYDFDSYTCVDASGFEWATNAPEMFRPIFIENPEDPDGSSLLAAFNVYFEEGTANVISAQAVLGGEDIGQRVQQTPSLAAI